MLSHAMSAASLILRMAMAQRKKTSKPSTKKRSQSRKRVCERLPMTSVRTDFVRCVGRKAHFNGHCVEKGSESVYEPLEYKHERAPTTVREK
jgi:hypothetical protein